MNKSPTPKEIMKNRIRNSKLLNIPKPAREPKARHSITINTKIYETHNRELTDDGFPNPFAIPKRMRVFTKEDPPRKVKPLPEILDDVRTVCDIHKDFYNVIEGRPLRQLDDIKVYMNNIRDLVDNRMNTGYFKDEMERIDHELREESEQFDKIDKLCNTYRQNYVKFLKLSFALAKNSQDKAEIVSIDLANISDQLEEYSFQYVRLRNSLAVVMGNYEKLLRYKKFLTSLAPAWWRVQFGGQSEHRLAKICAKLSSNMDIISKSSTEGSDTSLTYLKPVLFFNEPQQLMSVYDTMGRHGRNYLEIVNKSSGKLSKVRKHIENFGIALKESCAEMEDEVERYENIITFMEERETQCKTAFYKILFHDFKQLYSNYENIKLHTCVQYAYSRIFIEPEDPKDTTISLMRRLEGLYMKLCSQLDFLDVAVVNAATEQLFAQDVEMMVKAHNAHRQLQLCDILQKALYTSFEPPRNRSRVCGATNKTRLSRI